MTESLALIAALYGFIAPWLCVFWLGVITSRLFVRDATALIRLRRQRPTRAA